MIKDSGERRQFSTGSQRDIQEGKGRFDLIPYDALKRLAQHFEGGAKKYNARNWELGQPLSVYFNSATPKELDDRPKREKEPAVKERNFFADELQKKNLEFQTQVKKLLKIALKKKNLPFSVVQHNIDRYEHYLENLSENPFPRGVSPFGLAKDCLKYNAKFLKSERI